jgi:hypothetical protein
VRLKKIRRISAATRKSTGEQRMSLNSADRARILESNLSRVMAKLARFESALQRAHEGEQRTEVHQPEPQQYQQPQQQNQQQNQQHQQHQQHQQPHIQLLHTQQVSKRQKRSPINVKEIPDLTSNLAVEPLFLPFPPPLVVTQITRCASLFAHTYDPYRVAARTEKC